MKAVRVAMACGCLIGIAIWVACFPSDHTDEDAAHDAQGDDVVSDDTGGDDDGQALVVTVFNVGLGDSIFVETPDGARMLVDGGAIGEGQYLICPYFAARGITSLDVVVLTHPHYDHDGGLSEVFACVSVGRLWTNGQTLDDEAYRDFAAAVQAWGGTVQVPAKGDFLNVGAETTATVLHTYAGYQGTDATPVNNNSMALLLTNRYGRVLLGADLEEQGQEDVVADWPTGLASDIVKVPEHGVDPHDHAFVLAAHPSYAVVSVGQNDLGLPGQATIDDYTASGATVYRTDVDGTVRMTLTAGGITVETEVTK